MKTNTPQYLIKFFKPIDRKYLVKGNIKFGCLSEYRDEENEKYLGARSDKTDGELERKYKMGVHVDEQTVHISQFSLPGVKMTNVNLINTPNILTIKTQLNAWVFCSSIGPYTTQLHSSFLDNDESSYKGNPELTAYAIFDTRKLLRAISFAIKKHKILKNYIIDPSLVSNTIDYNKSASIIDAEKDVYASQGIITQKEYSKAIWSKKPEYKAENEYRIAINIIPDRVTEAKHQAIYLESVGIKRSIKHIGYWRE